MARRNAKFPATIYVERESETGGESWLVAHDKINTAATMDEIKDVAIYVLKEVKKVSVRVEIK